jgi:RHS repeat-associated protein
LFYTRDHLGSIREMVDGGGNLQARYDYDLYGQQTVLAETSAAAFGFTGHFQHRPSGLYLTLFRALDPRLGRWLSRDPLGEGAGLNLYAYVGNDPINSVDPLGDKDFETKTLEFFNDLFAGFADTVTLGKTAKWRDSIYGPGCDGVDKKSWTYTGGEAAGVVWWSAVGGAAVSKAKNAYTAVQAARLARAGTLAAEAGGAATEVTAAETVTLTQVGAGGGAAAGGGGAAAGGGGAAAVAAQAGNPYYRWLAAQAVRHFAARQHWAWAAAAYYRWLQTSGCTDPEVQRWMAGFFQYRYGLIPNWP